MNNRSGALLAVLAGTTAFVGAPAFAQDVGAPAAAAPRNEDQSSEGEVIVVTGTLRAKAPPSVAVSTLSGAVLDETVPVSAADLLRNVPGVFVNSALGEVRNIVYSRGISANSNEAGNGYYYVSLQEDGLPVTNVTFANYAPDFFYRQDLGLDRVEALRGGTAVVTGPNAPGGIFNYVTKTGRSDPGLEMRARLGLEGDGRNPFYRGDVFAGGQIGTRDLYYSVGAFYRHSVGPRDAGYAFNRGGQVKANLLWDYGPGSVLLYGKYLDDRNAFQSFLPATNYNDPVLAPGISRYDTITVTALGKHPFVETVNGPTKTFDPTDLVHATVRSVGLKFDHDLDGGWTIRNDVKYADNRLSYQTQAVAFPVPITEGTTNAFLNATRPGLYSYRNAQTGELLAQVRLAGGVRTVLLNNLPNQQVLANGVISQVAYNFNPETREIMDQLSVTKAFDGGSVTLGGFFAHTKYEQSGGGGGVAVSTIENNPTMLAISLTAPNGQQFAVTDPTGFAAIGQRFSGTPYRGKQRQAAIFGGVDFEPVEGLILEAAARYEWIRNSGSNDVFVGNPLASNPAYGGLDGNPSTLFDNFAGTYSTPFEYRFDLSFLSYSGAVTYELDGRNSLYARYSRGKKAPDVGFYLGYDTLPELQNLVPIPQTILQIEGGFRHSSRSLRLSLTPFYSKLSNVATGQIGTRADGGTYSPPAIRATTLTYGVELEGDVDFAEMFNLRTALTLQEGKSRDFAIWVFNQPGEADDTISQVPDGKLDNLPNILATTTLRFTPSDLFTSYVTWRHVGSRTANRQNAFDLPSFNEVDIGATFTFDERFTLGFNVNNVFNSRGVLSWAPGGALLAALDRQSLTRAAVEANPNQTFSIIENQPRAFFLTAGVKFN